MLILERIAEEKIKEAMEAGKFANLAGKGKPLKLEDNPFESEGSWACFRLLRSNGFTLPWIEYGQEIEAERLRLHHWLRQARHDMPGEREWQALQHDFAGRLAALNRRILYYNLQVPAPVFQRAPLDPQAEIRQALVSG